VIFNAHCHNAAYHIIALSTDSKPNMRLDLGEEDEEAKPTCLTPGYFNTLMNAKTKQKGVLQILSLKKKKDLAYSTRLSDGFFEAKVMVVHEAAKQLAG